MKRKLNDSVTLLSEWRKERERERERERDGSKWSKKDNYCLTSWLIRVTSPRALASPPELPAHYGMQANQNNVLFEVLWWSFAALNQKSKGKISSFYSLLKDVNAWKVYLHILTWREKKYASVSVEWLLHSVIILIIFWVSLNLMCWSWWMTSSKCCCCKKQVTGCISTTCFCFCFSLQWCCVNEMVPC